MESPQIEQPPTTLEPTQDVGTFWERLDQVLALNLESARMRNRVESLLEEFPDQVNINQDYKSAVFQPDRVALSSSDDANTSTAAIASLGIYQPGNIVDDGHRLAEYFSSFRIKFQKPLRKVKSIQLITASIPNATIQIPDNQLILFYYKIQSLANSSTFYNPTLAYTKGSVVSSGGVYYAAYQDAPIGTLPTNTAYWYNCGANGNRPNYFQLDINHIQFVYIVPTNFFPPERYAQATWANRNRQFQDYNDLLTTLNYCATHNPGAPPGDTIPTASLPGDISFGLDATLNRLVLVPSDTANYFYIPCGYEDPNITPFVQSLITGVPGPFEYVIPPIYKEGYILNTRLGFTWNGLYGSPYDSNPYANNTLRNALYNYMRPIDPAFPGIVWTEPVVTAQSYPDLVYTSVCRIYTDVTLASTEDSQSQGNLLSVVPMNANTLGIAYYQSAFNCPLTKIPETITEMNIRLITDAGDPFYLPNSAVVNLELAITYK